MSLIDLENPQSEVALGLYMNGREFEVGIPVHLLLQGFESTQLILDKAYLELALKKRLTQEERKHFFLLTRGVKHDSMESWMELVLTGVQTTIPVLGALGPTGIWEYSKQAYELLKFAYKAIKSDRPATYSHTGQGNIEVNNGTQTVIFNAPVYNIARATQKVYVDLAKQIATGHVDTFRLTSPRDLHGIELSANEAEFFDIPSVIDTTPIEVDCEIFVFNKFEDTGTLRVFEGQVLPIKDYRFEVVGSQADSDYIEAMLRKSVRITCLREVTVDPLAHEKIVLLQVLRVAA